MKIKIIFWIYDLNLHLFSLLKALNQKCDLLVIVEKEMNNSRIKDGWYIPDMEDIVIIISPTMSEVKKIIDSNSSAINFFLGIDAFKITNWGFKYATKKKAKVGVFLESGINLGLKGKLRKIKSIFNKIKYGNKIDFLMPMGYLGVKWYRSSFYPSSKIFPFLYVVENEKFKAENESIISNNEHLNLVVIAQCIKRKNINFLLNGLAQFRNRNWHLKIIGEGDQKNALINLAAQLNLKSKVEFIGTVSNKDVRNYLLESDLSILPSKWDGWGAVINESLMAGVPAICSTNCGSSCLINGERGDVFKANSKKSLSKVLEKWLSKGKTTDKTKESIKIWSNCLTGSSVADYVLEVIDYLYYDQNGNRPIEPWRKNDL